MIEECCLDHVIEKRRKNRDDYFLDRVCCLGSPSSPQRVLAPDWQYPRTMWNTLFSMSIRAFRGHKFKFLCSF